MPKIISNHVCKRCGKPIPYDRYRVYCEECGKANKRDGLLRERRCIDCGGVFVGYPKSKRCPECQSAADRAADREHKRRAARGKSRRIGETYSCEMCGMPYVLTSGRQKYCPDCADTGARMADSRATREWLRAHPEQVRARKAAARVCVICGAPITSKLCTVTCGSPECVKTRKRQHQRQGDAKRGEGKADASYTITKKTWRTKDEI